MTYLPASAMLLGALALLGAAHAQVEAWAPATDPAALPYHNVEELRSFYKLTTGVKSSRRGAYAIGNSDICIEFGPGSQDLRLGGIALCPAHALRRDASGNWLISREDWVAWIDPILRPTYIEKREAVKHVMLDPGHGGHDSGAEGLQLNEPEVTLQVARRLKAELEKRGYTVQLTRDEDQYISDQQRVDMANTCGPNTIFVSLHVNSGRSDFHGASVYSLAPGRDARPGHAKQASHAALAYALQSALVAQAGAADAGCRRVRFSLLSSITCPAVWVELGYGTHAQEGQTLATSAYQDTLAQALAQGIATYAHVADPATGIPVQTPPPRSSSKQSGSATARSASAESQRSATSTGSSSSASRSQSQRSSSSSSATRGRSQQPSKPQQSAKQQSPKQSSAGSTRKTTAPPPTGRTRR